MSQETAEIYAEAMRHLALKARGVVRDVNPKGEMKYMRIRAKRHEVLVAFGEATQNTVCGVLLDALIGMELAAVEKTPPTLQICVCFMWRCFHARQRNTSLRGFLGGF